MIADARMPPTNIAGYDPVATAPAGYWYDADAADIAVDFIESECVHIEGRRFTGKPFVLEPWQRDIQRTVYGWKRPDGTRRYQLVYEELPRKQGKTAKLAANVCLNAFCPAFAEPGGQMFSAAGDRAQASLVYRLAAAMAGRNPLMKRRCKIRPSQKRIVIGDTFYTAVAAGEGKQHGTNPSFVVADELHVWRGDSGRALWDEFLSGMGNREEPLLWAITTAGYDRSSLCWDQHQYAIKVRDGEIDDPSFLPILYYADLGDDWTDPRTWAKANPNLGVTVKPEFLEQECERAKASPLYENTFRRLYLNQWTEQAVRWMPMEDWRACPAGCDASELAGETCYAGMDIADTRDLTSLVLCFPRPDGVYRFLSFFWCPKEAISKRAKQDRQSFTGWIGKHITATEGKELDQSAIRAKLFELKEMYDIREVAYDPYNMTECRQQLIREGWPDDDSLLKFTQSTGMYNEPMKRSLEMVRARKLHHGRSPVLDWNAANVVAKTDHNGNIKPDKGKSQEKIDGFCAMLMALGRALAAEPAREWVYQKRGMVAV